MYQEQSLRINSDFTAQFEGFSYLPYLCPAGVPTIGYGTTIYPNGNRVTMNDNSCTKEQAKLWLKHELTYCMRYLLKQDFILNYNQLTAINDFIYNVGIGNFRSSTLRKRLISKDFDDIGYQLSRWKYGGGKVLKGLVIRRKKESELFYKKIENDNFLDRLFKYVVFK